MPKLLLVLVNHQLIYVYCVFIKYLFILKQNAVKINIYLRYKKLNY